MINGCRPSAHVVDLFSPDAVLLVSNGTVVKVWFVIEAPIPIIHAHIQVKLGTATALAALCDIISVNAMCIYLTPPPSHYVKK